MLCGIVTDGWSYQDNLLTKYQKKLGFDIVMVTSMWVWNNQGEIVKSDKDVYVNDDGIKVYRLKIKGKDDFGKKWKRFEGLREVLINEKPNILFIHNISFGDVDVVCKYLRNNKVEKVFVDNHMDSFNSGSTWLSKNILHKVIWKNNAKMLNPFVTRFYGVLPARVDWLKLMYGLPCEKCDLLVMGADTDLVRQVKNANIRKKIREKYFVNENEVLILAGGKIDKNKQEILTLMEAFNEMHLKNAKLMIFGSVIEEYKERFEKLLAKSEIIYVGWQDSKDIYSFLEASDLIAFPGLHSVLWEESVGLGKACIFRKIEGFMHIDLGGNCDFFEDISKEGMANKLCDVVNDGSWRRMENIAEKKGMKFFSYEEIAKRSIEYNNK